MSKFKSMRGGTMCLDCETIQEKTACQIVATSTNERDIVHYRAVAKRAGKMLLDTPGIPKEIVDDPDPVDRWLRLVLNTCESKDAPKVVFKKAGRKGTSSEIEDLVGASVTTCEVIISAYEE